MNSRYVALWFRHLLTDWHGRQHPDERDQSFVFTEYYKGQTIVTAANATAERAGIGLGMVLADARTLDPMVRNIEGKDALPDRILSALAGYCTRFTPKAAVMTPDVVVMDSTACAHLWGGEQPYLDQIVAALRGFGYDVRGAMADTIGAAWAVARYDTGEALVVTGAQRDRLSRLPPAALRLEDATCARLNRLGLRQIGQLYEISRSSLIRRFGQDISLRLDQALGDIQEPLVYLAYHEPYIENLMTPEGVATAEGIAGALEMLLNRLCERLHSEQRGVRYLVFDGFRVDGKVETIEIGTSRPSRNAKHLGKLFSDKLEWIEPALGIEQFRLTASQIEKMDQQQNSLLSGNDGTDDGEVKEMIDRLSNRFDPRQIFCFVPLERHWPESAVKAVPYSDKPKSAQWRKLQYRPVCFLPQPELIEVTAPVPDYPPALFRHKNKLHRVLGSDGPERIEREWWLDGGLPRDYYKLEDENGDRFWVFREGRYGNDQPPRWFLHGYFG